MPASCYGVVASAGLVVAAGCGAGAATDTAELSGAISGEVSSEDGSSAQVGVQHAFGYATGGTGVLYLASGEQASCADAAEYLDIDTVEYDPSSLWPPQTCNLFLRFTYDDAAGWDGMAIDGDDPLNPWVINCAMDAGEWEYGESNGFTDYFYTGRHFQGSPTDGSSSLMGTDESMALELSFSSFVGGFTYEQMENVDASGSVAGSLSVEWCPDLASTGYF